MFAPFAILSLGLLPWAQLSGATSGLLGGCELDRRLYGPKESSIADLLSATWVEAAVPEAKTEKFTALVPTLQQRHDLTLMSGVWGSSIAVITSL